MNIAHVPTSYLMRIRGLTRVLGNVPYLRSLVYLWVRLAAKLFDRAVVIEDLDGDLLFRCELATHMGGRIFWFGALATRVFSSVDQHLTRESIVFDVGANQGEISLYAAKRCHRVYSFEPTPIVKDLENHIALNTVENITVVNSALSDREGFLEFYDPDAGGDDGLRNEGMFTAYPDSEGSKPMGRYACVTLDSFVESCGDIDRIDLIKIDVEGAELDVLKGAGAVIERFRPCFLIELNEKAASNAGSTVSEIFLYLISRGYSAELAEPDGLKPITVEQLDIFQDVLFCPAT